METITHTMDYENFARGICYVAFGELSKSEFETKYLKLEKRTLMSTLALFIFENKEYKIKIKRAYLTTKEFKYLESTIRHICEYKKRKIEKVMALLKEYEPFYLECEII